MKDLHNLDETLSTMDYRCRFFNSIVNMITRTRVFLKTRFSVNDKGHKDTGGGVCRVKNDFPSYLVT